MHILSAIALYLFNTLVFNIDINSVRYSRVKIGKC